MRAKKVDWLDSKRFADDYSDDEIDESRKNNEIIDKVFTCSCGIHAITVTNYRFDEPETFITFWEQAFYILQESKVRSYFLRLWDAVRGKRHLLFEVVLLPDDVKALIETLQEAADDAIRFIAEAE